jgi:hypothetical protein
MKGLRAMSNILTNEQILNNLHDEDFFRKEVSKKCPFLGGGIGRKVYDIGNDRVLKYCLQYKIEEEGEWATTLQNKFEVKKSKILRKHYQEGFAEVLTYDPIAFKWIICKKILPSKTKTLNEKLIEVFGTKNVNEITKLFFMFMFPVDGLYDGTKLLPLYKSKIQDREYSNTSNRMTKRGSEAFELFYAFAKAKYKHPDLNIDNFIVDDKTNKLVVVDYGINYKQDQLEDFFDLIRID